MSEHALTVDAREAKGLHDGSITVVVRVVDKELWSLLDEIEQVNGHPAWRCLDFDVKCPLDADRLIAMPDYHNEPPCEHRGCKSHVTHPCEGCGRKWGVTLLDATNVRVVRLEDVTEAEYFATGRKMPSLDDHPMIPIDCWWWMDLCTELFPGVRRAEARQRWLWLATVAKVASE